MEFKKSLSTLVVSLVLLTQLQTGTFRAFEPLVQDVTAQAIPSTFTFSTAWEIRSFINSFPQYNDIQEQPDVGSGAPRFDDATALKVCELKGYQSVVSKTTSSYASCGDNTIGYWDAGQNNFVSVNACTTGGVYMWTLTCGTPIVPPQCSDGADNDGDGVADGNDFSCSGPTDNDEANPKAQCQDGVDNDGDGKIDNQDPGCTGSQDNDESPVNTQCNDGVDNDGDGAIDFPADFSCTSATDNDEANAKAQCQDGVDNDGDGKIDSQDPACAGPQDNDESPQNVTPQCSDGQDNDGDGRTDFPNDISCSDANDNDETLPKSECQDGIDNDADGQVDFSQDPGCTSSNDLEERNLQIDFRVNNQKTPVTVPYGSTVTVSWTTNDAKVCNTGTSAIPWGPNVSKPLTATEQLGPLTQSITVGFQCAEELNSNFVEQASVQVNVLPQTPASQCNDGQDNDGDGRTDFPNDAGCSSLADNNEADGQTDIAIAMTGPAAVAPNGLLTYNVALSNAGPDAATSPVAFKVNAPVDFTFLAENSSPECHLGQGVVDCTGITLGLGQQKNFVITFRAPPQAVAQTHTGFFAWLFGLNDVLAATSCGTFISNQAVVTSTPQGDPNQTNNQSAATTTQYACANAQCSDGVDNDGDGKTDTQDPQCHTDGNAGNPSSYDPNDSNESGSGAQCSDGQDNDGDGVIDGGDSGCHTDQNIGNPASYDPNDNSEAVAPNQCIVIHATTHSGGADNSYAIMPSGLPSNIVVRTLNLRNQNLTQADLQDAKLFIFGDSNLGRGTFRSLSGTEKSFLTSAFNAGLNFTFAADNPTSDEASFGTRDIMNSIQSSMRYSDSYRGSQSGTHQPNTTAFPFLVGKVFDFSNSGISSPGDIENINSPAVCAFSLNGRCHAGWLPATGGKGFLFAEGNAGLGSQNYLRNFIDMACGTTPPPPPPPQCSDNADNDGDGKVDAADPQCHTDGNASNPNSYNPTDNNEAGTGAQCSDGRDNDGDNLIDGADAGCHTDGNAGNPGSYDPNDNSEATDPNQCIVLHTSTYAVGPNGSAARLPSLPGVTVRTVSLYNNQLTAADIADVDMVVYGDWNGARRTLTSAELNLFKGAYDTGTDFAFFADNPIIDEASFGTRQIMNFIQSRMKYSDNTTGIAHSGTHTPNTAIFPYLLGKIFNFTGGLNSPGFIENIQSPAVCAFSNAGFCIAAFKPSEGAKGFVFAEGNWGAAPTGVTPGQGSAAYIKNFIDMACGNTPPPPPPPQCSDNVDNDGDNKIDIQDPQCHTDGNAGNPNSYDPNDNSEAGTGAQCSDGRDNDGDNVIDGADAGCHTDGNANNPSSYDPNDNDEQNAAAPQFTAVKQGASNVSPGELMTYIITIQNTGNVTQSGIQVVDNIPGGLTFTTVGSTSGCNQVGNAVVCAPQTFTPGQTASYTLKFTANANICTTNPVSITNTANVQQNGVTFKSTNAFVTPVQCVIPKMDVTKSAPPVSQLGGQVTYTYVVRNTHATLAAPNVHLFDFNINPQNTKINQVFTFASSSLAPGKCVVSAQNQWIDCDLGTVQPNQTLTVTLTFNIPNNQALCNQTVINQVDVWSGTDSANADWDKAQTQVQCNPAPSFTAVKQGNVVITPGEVLTYIVTIQNIGTASQNGIQVADTIPAGLTFTTVGSTSGCNQVGNAVVCPAQTFAPGQSASYTLKFTANANICTANPGPINNIANVQQNGVTFKQTNNFQTALQCTFPKLDITKSAPAVSQLGGTVTYTYTLRNTSATLAAPDVKVFDFYIDSANQAIPYPSPFSYNSSSLGNQCAFYQAQNRVICNVGTLQPSQTITFTIVYNIPNNQQLCGQTIVNQVDAWSGTDEPNADWDKAQTQVQCAAQNPKLYIVKTAPATITAGQNATYNFKLSNTSAFPATNVVVSDYYINSALTQIPSPFTFVSSSGITCSNDTMTNRVVCLPVNLAAGQEIAFTMTFSTPTNNQALCNTTITNKGEAIANNVQSTIDTDTAPSLFQCPVTPPPSFVVNKVGSTAINPGDVVTYIITAQNTGNVAQSGIELSDDVPAGLTFETTGSTPGCVVHNNEVYCAEGTYQPGETKSFTLKFRVSPTYACNTRIDNVAALEQNDTAFAWSNHFYTDVRCGTPKLDITKTAPPVSQLGGTVTYNYVIRNTDAAVAATNVHFYDFNINVQNQKIAPPFTFVTSNLPGNPCSYNAGELKVVCELGTLAPSQVLNMTLTFSIPNNQNLCGQVVINQVDVWPGTDEANADWDKAQTQVQCPTGNVDLVMQKTGPATVTRGNNITYSLTVTNNGPAAAQNVVISDPIPAGLSFVSSSGGSCSVVNNALQCTVASLASGQSTGIITATFAVPTIANCTQTTLTNTAAVTSGSTETNTANNSSTAVTSVLCTSTQADVSVSKSGPTTVTRGNTASYTLTVTNNGPGTAESVVLHDPFTSVYTFQSASGATCSVVGSEVQCNLGTMTSGQAITVTLVFNVPTVTTCSTVTVQNTATVTSSTTDPTMSNNTSQTVSTTVNCSGSNPNDITVYKTDNRSSVNTGERLRYSIILTNNTNAAITDLIVSDPMPYGLTVLTVSDGGNVNGQTVRWTSISVPANSSRTLYVDAEVRNDVGNGTVLRNTVDVAGKQSTDETTVYGYTTPNPPPYYPPTYNPPPVYYPPVQNPPVYYPPVTQNPPVYYPPVQQPIYPVTGTRDTDLYADTKADGVTLTKIADASEQNASNGFSAAFYATLVTFLAVGSAAASRMFSGGLI